MFSFGNIICTHASQQWVQTAACRIGLPFLRNRKGVTAIEFAIMLPVLLLVVFGTIEFGQALKARNEMSHALSRAVRVINLDKEQTTGAIKELLGTYLSNYGSEDLTVNVSSTSISGSDYMKISVSFPFHASIPLSSVSILSLKVETLAPMISPTK